MAGQVTSRGAWAVAGWCLVLAAVVCGPLLLGRGFALVGDMVFVPEQPWKDRWLGLDGSVPRAVPSDALVSAVTQAVPGDLVQKVALLGLLVAAGWGVARLVADAGVVARTAAVSLFVWNPFVYERLAIGHWALLCGYAALPWVALTAGRVRDGWRGALATLVVPLGAAAVTSPTGGVLAGVVALAVVLPGSGIRRVAATLGAVVAVNLPWLLPGILSTHRSVGASAGDSIAAFAARPDTDLGSLGSLLSLGGIWKSSVVPPERGSLLLATVALMMVLAGLAGAGLAARAGDRTMTGLLAAAAVGLTLAWLPSTAAGRSLLVWGVEAIPGGELVRDSHKWVALVALPAAAGMARLVDRVARLAGHGGVGATWSTALVVLPLAVLPGMAWGQLGRLHPVQYPAEWSRVAALMAQRVAPGERVVVLPFEIYTRFAWNRSRAALDPAPRFFSGELVSNDVLRLEGGRALPAENPAAARIARALRTAAPETAAARLADEGVAWVLVEKDTPGERPAILPDLGDVVHDGAHLRLLRLRTDAAPVASPPWRPVVLAADAAVAAWLAWDFGLMLARRRRGTVGGERSDERSPSPREGP